MEVVKIGKRHVDWGGGGRCKTHQISFPNRKERERIIIQRANKKIFLEFQKDTLKVHQILHRMNKNKSIPSHIIVTLLNIKHQEKNIKIVAFVLV